MVKLFVHGNPETTFVWSDLVPELNRRGVDDIVLASPPGFGAPVPEGFGGTEDDHRDWLIGEIEAVGEPVDLVGHDWGAIHAYAVAAERPDLLRSLGRPTARASSTPTTSGTPRRRSGRPRAPARRRSPRSWP